jgi:hypothetical protein
VRFGIELELVAADAVVALEAAHHAGLTTDTEFHPKHCACVEHERQHNSFHATWDNGQDSGEFVSRILDSDSLEDEFLIARMEHILCSLPPATYVNIHVHVECALALIGPVTEWVQVHQDELAALVEAWAYDPERCEPWFRTVGKNVLGTVDEHSPLRVVENELTDQTHWLRHPTKPLRAHPDWSTVAWVRFTELGTAEFRWWHGFVPSLHLWDAVKVSLGIVEAARRVAAVSGPLLAAHTS